VLLQVAVPAGGHHGPCVIAPQPPIDALDLGPHVVQVQGRVPPALLRDAELHELLGASHAGAQSEDRGCHEREGRHRRPDHRDPQADHVRDDVDHVLQAAAAHHQEHDQP
jgi:hypothetical protein